MSIPEGHLPPGNRVRAFGLMPGPDFENRRLRLDELRVVAGSQVRLADRLGVGSELRLAVAERPPKKRISDETIAKASAAFELPPGWFDQPAAAASAGNVDLLTSARSDAPSLRAMRIAERLDALSEERRMRTYAIVDLNLRAAEAEERAERESESSNRRSHKHEQQLHHGVEVPQYPSELSSFCADGSKLLQVGRPDDDRECWRPSRISVEQCLSQRRHVDAWRGRDVKNEGPARISRNAFWLVSASRSP